ncbi:glycosyltransferase family 2 protein [Lacticaseibacillus baoqingensis]|uniref:Glycosyltransferase family 2 protein n=1 Tax=Lacticaseibacillus baoqingensis TaxID=2486013 RepID=A0ABW4E3J5_9LACO|nr:glycosyltransferase family A protein [Lacticaseibacillus baoqingensis]
MKQLSIIITYHNETPEQIRRAFASVTMQVEVDFTTIEVLLVGDGVAALPNSWLPMPKGLLVRQLNYTPSRGAGVARQVGIEHTTGRYFMFIDADDVLQDVFVLRDMLKPTQTANDDMIIARYTKQHRFDGQYQETLSAKFDWKAAYAKLYNRAYIKRVGLKWRPDLRIFEDTYFVGLACELAHSRKYLDRSVYVWLWNPASTVRKDDHAFDHQLQVWARSNRYSLAMLREKKPAVWPRDFYHYMADLFYRVKVHAPADQAAFLAEHQALLVANRSLWTPAGQAQVRAEITRLQAADAPYAGLSQAGLDAYLAAQTGYLKQAYQQEVTHG